MKTQAAQAAALIRKELKKYGIKNSVRSDNYSGGSSIHIDVYDQLPATIDLIEEFCSQFKAGYFDGMQDMYVYNHDRTGPTVSFVFVSNKISDDLYAKAEAFVKDFYSNPGEGYQLQENAYYQLRNKDSAFWKQNKPRIAA